MLIYNAALKEGLVVGDPLDKSEVYGDELYSFYVSDHIICIFLHYFKTKRETYQNEMKKVTGSFILCDYIRSKSVRTLGWLDLAMKTSS